MDVWLDGGLQATCVTSLFEDLFLLSTVTRTADFTVGIFPPAIKDFATREQNIDNFQHFTVLVIFLPNHFRHQLINLCIKMSWQGS